MRSTRKVVAACAVTAILLAAAGCGSNGDDGGDPGNGASGGGNSDSPQTPSSALMMGNTPAGQTPVPVSPVVEIQTTMGNITIELDNENAPATVDNFLRYVENGFYDQTIFHQVFPGAVILGGMFTPELAQKETGPPVRNEADNGLKNQRGTIAMFRDYDIIDSATCQFFINAKDNPNYDHKPGAQETLSHEDYGYCVFGRVSEESMGVVDRIANVEVHDTAGFERIPVRTVLIKSIRKIR